MNRIQELDAIVNQFDLNNHPFYQEWRMGTLPSEKLVDYAGEYGRFVATIAKGWETTGHGHYAEEEREHELLWNDFKSAIGFEVASNRPETVVLETAADQLFADRATAVGALYSFEAQQPNTAKSKLDGLNEHYSISDAGKEYFRVHAADFAEIEELRRVVETMSDEEFARTKTACAVLCAAMWSALDGVYYARA
jgi:pyrroloquinoline-quinone synthase